MKNKLIKDLPIYINGIAVGWLTFGRLPFGVAEIVCLLTCLVSFLWYGENQKQ